MKYLYVIITSNDTKAVTDTIRIMQDTGYMLNRPTVFVNSFSDNPAFSKSLALLNIRQNIKKLEGEDDIKTIRAVFLDSNILLENKINVIKDYILKADKEGSSFVIPYRINSGTIWSVRKDPNIPIKDWSEIEKLEWKKVPYSELGFYYGDVPLDYRFHEKYLSIDDTMGWLNDGITFLYENKIKPKVATQIRAYYLHSTLF